MHEKIKLQLTVMFYTVFFIANVIHLFMYPICLLNCLFIDFLCMLVCWPNSLHKFKYNVYLLCIKLFWIYGVCHLILLITAPTNIYRCIGANTLKCFL